jgi:hypothetical protein
MSTIHPARSPRGDSRHSSVYATGSARLAAYLATGVGASLVGTPDAEAAVVMINLGPTGLNLLATNGGMSPGSYRLINNWLGAGTGNFIAYNRYVVPPTETTGLSGTGGLGFAVSALANVSPANFGLGASIGSGATFTSNPSFSAFEIYNSSSGNSSRSPNFGAGSFMGFRFGSGSNWNYGYLEVTWSTTFQILSGAYESTVNTAIAAGATPIPAPSALALLALGGGAFRRARARAA